jgi:hypothetical protein
MALVITDDSTREQLAEAIGHLRNRQRRLPIHWEDDYETLSKELEKLVNAWLKADA